jgi:hypothetical protein
LADIYTRRLSTTEFKEGFILILKDKVKLFPNVGKSFTLRFKGKEFKTRIEAIDCTCQGPNEPHVHWHLDAHSFMTLLRSPRPHITIRKVKDNAYEMEEA